MHKTVRHPGAPNDLPGQSDVDDVLSRTDWNDFNGAIEDVHDAVHGWVSGDMGVVGTAAFDQRMLPRAAARLLRRRAGRALHEQLRPGRCRLNLRPGTPVRAR
jgi:hypothetical protein